MSIFRLNKVLDAVRGKNSSDEGDRTEALRRNTQRRISELRQQIKSARRVLHERERGPEAGGADGSQRKKSKKLIQQEIFPLRRELKAAKRLRDELRARRRRTDEPPDRASPQLSAEVETGALPDFLVIGEKKCGTTYFYDLLTRHPHVEPAASKELHYFDAMFEQGTEWYRRCFPAPRLVDGRRTITGEATPYMPSRRAPERIAGVVPGARLISLLRNPVDRAYSDYQQVAGKGRDTRTFEEAVADENSEYLTRSVYVDQLLHWSRFFPREQLLVLQSEDFFERPAETMRIVLGFLDLPGWEPGEAEKRNTGAYAEGMNPDTRRRLEDYFRPHNRRLYEYLGADFGW